MLKYTFIALLSAAVALVGCGKDPAPAADTGSSPDLADASDMGSPDAQIVPDTGADLSAPDMPVDTLCTPCTDNEQCGSDDDLCITIVEGESFCARDCDEAAPCPAGFFCGVLDADTGVQQCVPDNLTCIDRCSDSMCAASEVCDPFTGECRRPLRLCETGCVLNSLCGDGPEDICLSVPNTPDSERSCFTGCNPEAETSECPADYFCAALDPDNAPQTGVCYPFDGTCVDRCAAVDCAAGQNCDPVSGQCSAALYGPCDPGCTNSAECGGQDDVCLNLGIGDDAHCWQDCTAAACPSGYDCRSLLGSTLRICIPLGNDCSACYDNACFPDSVCDPIADSCEPLPRSCTTAGDCGAGELCDPISTSCVAIGRACNGSTWAIDCDNAVTKCTSQRAGVDGRCEQLCATDADCVSGSCVDTNLGRMCLDNLGGSATCGSLLATGTSVGRACSPGNCLSSAPQCVDGGNIVGFCSNSCTSDASCGANQICGSAVGETGDRCLPANCLCAGALGGGAGADAALTDALDQLGLNQCMITFDEARFATVASVLSLPGESTAVTGRVAHPVASAGVAQTDASRLDQATNDVATATAAAAAIYGTTFTPRVRSFNYPGPERPLAQAIAELITAGGGTPDLVALDTAVSGVPDIVGTAAAPLVSAVAVGVGARRALIASTWGGGTQPQTLFDGAPWTLLPADSAQAAVALDPTVVGDAQLLSEGAAFARELVAGADFVGQIPDVAASLSALGPQTFATISIPTPAGRVVIADTGADTHDPATHGAEIALLIDLGGDDTYTIGAGANASVANGVSVLLDLGGSDSYGYPVVADPNDGILIPSDADGRIAATLPLNQANGPVSASGTGRQGSARLGVGILVDLGAGLDTYESLRISQGASVLGLGVLYDDGAANFRAEALSQGAAFGGVGALFAIGTALNSYTIWHAGQGFGAMGGAGIAYDQGGDDTWTADPGSAGTVLYLSTADRGVSNYNLAQGVGFGDAGRFAGGIGILRDLAGDDAYTAGTYAQGYARVVAFAAVVDGSGNDVWNARGLAQAVGELRGGATLRDAGGNDEYNQTTAVRVVGQGVGQTLGWAIFADLGGDDLIGYFPSGGGVALDGGFGLALSSGGSDTHTSSSDATWGVAQINAMPSEPGFGSQTIGIFIDTGANTDIYARPTLTGIGDGGVWSPGANPPIAALGVDN